MVDGATLEMSCTETYRRFESCPLRQKNLKAFCFEIFLSKPKGLVCNHGLARVCNCAEIGAYVIKTVRLVFFSA